MIKVNSFFKTIKNCLKIKPIFRRMNDFVVKIPIFVVVVVSTYCVAKSFHSTIRNTIFLEPQLIIVIRLVVSRLSDETRVLGSQLDFQFYGTVKLKIIEI